MDFIEAVGVILKFEGGDKITHDPKDPGGLTKYGISKRAHPGVDIAGLSEAGAIKIYHDDYWVKSKAPELPGVLRLAHFDAFVQHRPGRANILLQSALKVRRDGDIGDKTLSAAKGSGSDVLGDLLAHRALFYQRLVAINPDNQRFIFGWLGRIAEVGFETGKRVIK